MRLAFRALWQRETGAIFPCIFTAQTLIHPSRIKPCAKRFYVLGELKGNMNCCCFFLPLSSSSIFAGSFFHSTNLVHVYETWVSFGWYIRLHLITLSSLSFISYFLFSFYLLVCVCFFFSFLFISENIIAECPFNVNALTSSNPFEKTHLT